jgi:acetate kinase
LEFLGVHIDESANDRHAGCISSESAAVTTRVIRTDEESVIAASSIRVLGLKPT